MKENQKHIGKQEPRRRVPYWEGSIGPTVHKKSREGSNTSTPVEESLYAGDEIQTGGISESSLRFALLSAEDRADIDDYSPGS